MFVFPAVQTQIIVLAALVGQDYAKAFAARTASIPYDPYSSEEERDGIETRRRSLLYHDDYYSLLDTPDLNIVSGAACYI